VSTDLPWTEWITREKGSGEFPEFTLVCAHGSMPSEAMKRVVGVEDAVNLLRKLLADYPDVPVADLTLASVRLLMGWALAAAYQCECANQPWAVVFDPEAGFFRIEDYR
jgi:hypothetical protein